jgi:UDP-N-acetyl-alpha-D-muramoyl-L-alanyl-L-glutamate epimerase
MLACPFDMNDYPFIFTSYFFNQTSGEVLLTYTLGDLEFVETITVPMKDVDMDKIDREELDRALFALHLMAGVSYYKTTCAKEIKIESGSLSKSQATFWNETYTHGLGEFFYTNQIDFRNLISFPFENQADEIKLEHTNRTPNPLVPIGGGKDSILTAELLKNHNLPFTTLTIKEALPIKNTSEIIGNDRLVVSRSLSPKLSELNNQEGIYNGHVPITGVLSFLSVVIAILHNKTDVIFSLEQTASEGNLEYLGNKINHQYSKSLEFEQAVQSYLSSNITKNVRVFSLIRPLSEFDIVKRFSKLDQYFPVFSSCNKNFTFENTGANTKTFWCCECPKCAFMFAMLSAWLTHDQVVEIFGQDLFSKPELENLFKQLLGIQGNKPFECVGTAEETAAAFELAYRRGDANDTPIMKMYASEVQDSLTDPDNTITQLLTPSPDHAIPLEYQKYSPALSPLEQVANSKTLLLGFAATNRSLLKAILKTNPDADIAIADQSDATKAPSGIKSQLGSKHLDNLSDFDIIIRSHGVPYGPELDAVKSRVKGAAQLFFEHVRFTSNAHIIGITGTKGKSTTATLIHMMLQDAGKRTLLVGNINAQEWDWLDQITDDTYIVYELSSYMLEDFTENPDISVWLNVYDDHLTWHNNSPDEYTQAKANICANQDTSNTCIFNARDTRVSSGARSSKAELVDFTQKEIDLGEVHLRGDHNRENMLAALCAVNALGIPETDVLPALRAFSGLPHRLDTVATVSNIEYVDDLLATNPESTIAAIKSFNNISCLILGGEDRGYDYTQLAKQVNEIENLILLPGCRNKLKTTLTNFPGTIHEVESVEEAVKTCQNQAKPNTVVLFSPAAPSYDQFKNYEEKAEAFKQAIENL